MRIAAIFVILMTLLTSAAAVTDAEVKTEHSYILMDARTHSVLEECQSRKTVDAGYLTKLMSLLLIAQDIESGKYSLDTVITASSSVQGTKGSVIWLESGDKLTAEELIKAVIIGNANDALTVLAERSETSVENFVMRMNAEAFDLGLRDTAFYSPYGYEEDNNRTTAYDLAVICSELSEYDFLLPYFSIWHDYVKEGTVELVNENTLSRTFEPHIGFKAAHSVRSGYCAAEAGRDDEGTICIAVVLGYEDAESSLAKAKKLILSGFSGYKLTSTMFPDEMMKPVRVKNGVHQSAEIMLRAQNSVIVPESVREMRTAVVIPEYVIAPLKKGQKIGTAAFYSGDSLVYESDIVIKDDVRKLSFRYVFKEMMLNILN